MSEGFFCSFLKSSARVMVDEKIVVAKAVVDHLKIYSLEAKSPERLGSQSGARVLGVRVTETADGGATRNCRR